MILSNDSLVAFHYRSYGTFFYTKIGSIISIGDLPTTNIIEPENAGFCNTGVAYFNYHVFVKNHSKMWFNKNKLGIGNYFHRFLNNSIKQICKDKIRKWIFRCLLTKRSLFLRSTNLLKLRIIIILVKSKSIFGAWSTCSSWLFFILKTCPEPIRIYIIKLANKKWRVVSQAITLKFQSLILRFF